MTLLTQPTTDMSTFLQIDRCHGPVKCLVVKPFFKDLCLLDFCDMAQGRV
jgi:hypothetical protein